MPTLVSPSPIAAPEPPAVTQQPPSFEPWPHFAEDEVQAAAGILRSGKVNYWTGDQGRRFEQEYAQHTGCNYAIALTNGTVALELALRALGIGPGDEVITTPRTFIASASCIAAVGARPVFADVDPETQNLTPGSVRSVLTGKTKAIIAVHLAGWPCDMDGIMALAREHGLRVIEDCAQSHGATCRGRPVGSIGDIGAFSFCQDKIISTAGEGGMITLNSEPLYKLAWSYKDHGKNRDLIQANPGTVAFRWLHESFGTNWRLPEIQSAIGRLQLRKLSSWLALRRSHADLLNQRLEAIPALRRTIPPPHIGHAYYKYYVFLRPEMLRAGWTRDRIIAEIQSRGVPCFSGSCSEIYLEAAFPAAWRPPQPLPVARQLGETSLMFLVHPTLSQASIERTADAILEVMAAATC